ncbi:TIGR02444 family protein [Aurantimonas aggregata]|uniref:TIGR02444 family protein n=1 Tax=Aurantimonas aggregata TaxID=2047720 RepID=A0A6L9MKC5_9HYPH|nr:TIGR02444 family protein [Aurantimonas aggregata]NDV88211.1 TIGR02444 family protein [Aurantimonas aggregata]
MTRSNVAGPEGRERLRDFALRLYAAEGTAGACLGLQQRQGANVNVILYAAWCGVVRGTLLAPKAAADAAAAVRDWHESAVIPLRNVRTDMKARVSGPLAAEIHAVREKVKQVEIEAELIELDQLEAMPLAAEHDPDPDSLALRSVRNAMIVFAEEPLAEDDHAAMSLLAMHAQTIAHGADA